jgi:hypothetical protein
MRRKQNWMTGARLSIVRGMRERQDRAGREALKSRRRVTSAGKLGKMFSGQQKKSGGMSAVASDVVLALKEQGYSNADAKRMVRSASGSDFASFFRDAIKRNPRMIPAVTDVQLQALRKLVRLKTMATKKRRSKKKNSRKGKMPAGLKAYWAKKRRAKAKRRNPGKKRKPAPRRRRKLSLRVRTFRKPARRRTSKPRRRVRKSNPRRGTVRIKAPYGLGPKGLAAFRRLASKAYGVPARIVKP